VPEQPNIFEWDGPQGGEYYVVELSDGRWLSVSRKSSDQRVWLGRRDDPPTYRGQAGGIGRVDKLLDEWRRRIALDPVDAELYWALSALATRKRS
jgi:hypothetical protein